MEQCEAKIKIALQFLVQNLQIPYLIHKCSVGLQIKHGCIGFIYPLCGHYVLHAKMHKTLDM